MNPVAPIAPTLRTLVAAMTRVESPGVMVGSSSASTAPKATRSVVGAQMLASTTVEATVPLTPPVITLRIVVSAVTPSVVKAKSASLGNAVPPTAQTRLVATTVAAEAVANAVPVRFAPTARVKTYPPASRQQSPSNVMT